MEHDQFERVLVQNLRSLERVLLADYRRARTSLGPSVRNDVHMFATQCASRDTSMNSTPGDNMLFPEGLAMEGPEVVPDWTSQQAAISSNSAILEMPETLRPTAARKSMHRGSWVRHRASSWQNFAGRETNSWTTQELDADKFLLYTMTFGRLPHLRPEDPEKMTSCSLEMQLVLQESEAAYSSVDDLPLLGHTSFADVFMNVIVLANIAIVGISTDLWKRWKGWLIVDAVFAGIFLTELFVRLRYNGYHRFLWGPSWRWNVLEALLALLAVCEVITLGLITESDGRGKLSFLRIIRLARVAKILRVLRMEIFAELAQMIEGSIGGLRTLLWSCVMIVIPLYTLAVVLRDTVGRHATEEKGAESFDSLPNAFFTVFRCVVTGDCTTENGVPIFVLITKNYGWSYAAVYFFTMVFCTFGIFNVVTAVFVEKIVTASKHNALVQKRRRLQDSQLLATKSKDICLAIMRVCKIRCRSNFNSHPLMDLSQEDILELARAVSKASITPLIWEILASDTDFCNALFDLDISEEDQEELFRTVDADGSGTISAVELITAICKLRGDPKRSDIVGVSLMAYHIYAMLCDTKAETAAIMAQQARITQTMRQTVPKAQRSTENSGAVRWL